MFIIFFPSAYIVLGAAVLELVRVVTQCGHLVGDTIVQGSATSHMVPVEQADGRCVRRRVCVCVAVVRDGWCLLM